MKWEPMKFKPKKDIYWDNWGRMVRVFVKGRTYNGEIARTEDKIYVCAETPYYEEISDSLPLDEIEILEED